MQFKGSDGGITSSANEPTRLKIYVVQHIILFPLLEKDADHFYNMYFF